MKKQTVRKRKSVEELKRKRDVLDDKIVIEEAVLILLRKDLDDLLESEQ
jgi:hypothetical protein